MSPQILAMIPLWMVDSGHSPHLGFPGRSDGQPSVADPLVASAPLLLAPELSRVGLAALRAHWGSGRRSRPAGQGQGFFPTLPFSGAAGLCGQSLSLGRRSEVPPIGLPHAPPRCLELGLLDQSLLDVFASRFAHAARLHVAHPVSSNHHIGTVMDRCSAV